MALWPWFEIKRLKSVQRMLHGDLDDLENAYARMRDENARLRRDYDDMKTKEMITELHRKQLQDKLEAFSKFDPDGDGKPGGKVKTKKKA